MTQASRNVIQQYLDDVITAEKAFERQLLDFAESGDDDEVRAAMAQHADETRRQYERLEVRLVELGGRLASNHTGLTSVLDVAPRIAESGGIIEEQTLQNLLIAYTVEAGELAMYEALATLARAAGNPDTERLAREIQAEERQAAERIWHFLPSRSKIAFNMLTVSEIDPSVETKIADNRLVEG